MNFFTDINIIIVGPSDDIEKYKLPGNLWERLAREFKEMMNMRIAADYYMVY